MTASLLTLLGCLWEPDVLAYGISSALDEVFGGLWELWFIASTVVAVVEAEFGDYWCWCFEED